ncbi:MAG TPA: ATPase, T2SS/T4P/T4SS family, partial [Gaiellaceae bacterium]
MNTGHEGSLTTIHANTPRDALHRLEMLVLIGGLELPLRAIREQIASAFDLIVHLVRLVDGSRRVSRVTEVAGMEGDVVTMQDLFMARAADNDGVVTARTALLGPLRPVGLLPNFLPKLAAHGVELPTRAFLESAP